MSYSTKRLKNIVNTVDTKKTYSLQEAVEIIKTNATAKFNETIEISVTLNIDAKKSEQNIRGAVVLPHGNGKTHVIAVFAKDGKAEEAKNAGADIVGDEDLVEQIQKGNVKFNRCIATPDMMAIVGKAAKILGPKGLMPNPKLGTVTNDIASIISDIKKGMVEYKTDKNGIVHAGVAKASFDISKIVENINTFIDSITKSKPATIKGAFIKKMSISSTMGIGLTFTI